MDQSFRAIIYIYFMLGLHLYRRNWPFNFYTVACISSNFYLVAGSTKLSIHAIRRTKFSQAMQVYLAAPMLSVNVTRHGETCVQDLLRIVYWSL